VKEPAVAETSRSNDDTHPVLNATRARQGRFGRHMFWVLVAGTALAAIGLFLAWTYKAPALSAAEANRSQAQAAGAQSFSAPQSAPVTGPPQNP
jgi:hypothetical protein